MQSTLMKRFFVFLAVAAMSLLAVGCGDDDKNETERANTPPASTTPAPDMNEPAMDDTGKASELRSALTALLDDHVYLASAAIATGLAQGLDSKQFERAAGTLDKNSVELSQAIGSVYGPEAEKAFLPLWREHIGMFVEYSKGAATNDQALQDKAKKDLDEYRTTFGAFLESANPNLPADAVAEELEPHVSSLFAVIDAAAAGDTKVYDLITEAASHMPMTAKVLAGGIAEQFPDKFGTGADSGAADLRAALTSTLNGHVYLAGFAVQAGVTQGLDSEAFKAAAGALDANSVGLSKAIGSVYGPEAEKAFLPLWRSHIDMFVDYTKGVATDDKKAAEKALSDLDEYRTTFGAFLESANPNLPADAVAEELAPHVETLAAAIRGVAFEQPTAIDRLKEAASHMPHTAGVLAGAIVTQFPDKFTGSAGDVADVKSHKGSGHSD